MQPAMIPDDNLIGIIPGIRHPPKIYVDYLSHDWKKDDIWTSWKVMSKRKKELANGIRLENASWRTWAKQKYNLKTVNPNKLNWMKDSDITWLYGPLHTAWSNHIETSPKSQTTEDELNLMPSSKLIKSCLKKKSILEMLRPIIKGKYGSLVASNSDTQLYKNKRDSDANLNGCETASTYSSVPGQMTSIGPTKSILLLTEKNVSHHRKIQFNDCVEQYISIDSEDNSDDDGIEMNISSKKKRKDLTIYKLAPTKLKEDRIHNNKYSSLYSNYRRRATSSNPSRSVT